MNTATMLFVSALVLTATAASAQTPTTPVHADSMPAMQMDNTTSHHHDTTAQFAFGAPAQAGKATRTILIKMGDVTFDPPTVAVRPGEVVRFVITNTSSIDHEFTLGDAATEEDHRKEMADMMDRGESMAHDDPNAITVKSGQTRELTWKFRQGGQVEYDCNIPGHYEAGMSGLITVR